VHATPNVFLCGGGRATNTIHCSRSLKPERLPTKRGRLKMPMGATPMPGAVWRSRHSSPSGHCLIQQSALLLLPSPGTSFDKDDQHEGPSIIIEAGATGTCLRHHRTGIVALPWVRLLVCGYWGGDRQGCTAGRLSWPPVS
jgi:hypothetical protein